MKSDKFEFDIKSFVERVSAFFIGSEVESRIGSDAVRKSDFVNDLLDVGYANYCDSRYYVCTRVLDELKALGINGKVYDPDNLDSLSRLLEKLVITDIFKACGFKRVFESVAAFSALKLKDSNFFNLIPLDYYWNELNPIDCLGSEGVSGIGHQRWKILSSVVDNPYILRRIFKEIAPKNKLFYDDDFQKRFLRKDGFACVKSAIEADDVFLFNLFVQLSCDSFKISRESFLFSLSLSSDNLYSHENYDLFHYAVSSGSCAVIEYLLDFLKEEYCNFDREFLDVLSGSDHIIIYEILNRDPDEDEFFYDKLLKLLNDKYNLVDGCIFSGGIVKNLLIEATKLGYGEFVKKFFQYSEIDRGQAVELIVELQKNMNCIINWDSDFCSSFLDILGEFEDLKKEFFEMNDFQVFRVLSDAMSGVGYVDDGMFSILLDDLIKFGVDKFLGIDKVLLCNGLFLKEMIEDCTVDSDSVESEFGSEVEEEGVPDSEISPYSALGLEEKGRERE